MSPSRAARAALLLLAACQAEPPDPAPAPPPIAGPAPVASSRVPVPAESQAAAVPPASGPPAPGSVDLAGRPFFCAPLQPLPRPPPYCTRSIGQVDCWTYPPLALPPRSGLADGRATLTPAQAARRRQCWPGFL